MFQKALLFVTLIAACLLPARAATPQYRGQLSPLLTQVAIQHLDVRRGQDMQIGARLTVKETGAPVPHTEIYLCWGRPGTRNPYWLAAVTDANGYCVVSTKAPPTPGTYYLNLKSAEVTLPVNGRVAKVKSDLAVINVHANR